MHSSLIIIPENRCNDGGLLILRHIHKKNPPKPCYSVSLGTDPPPAPSKLSPQALKDLACPPGG